MSTVEDICRSLVALDRIDHEVWAIDGELRDEPQAITADADTLAAHKAEHARLETTLKAARSEAGAFERELANIETRRTRAQNRIANLVTAEQIAATEREIANLGEQADEAELSALEGMESVEKITWSRDTEVTAIATGEVALAVRREAWNGRKAEIETRRSVLETEREPLFGDLRGDVARRYKVGWNMPFYKPPSGLTGADGIMCTTCRTTLSPKWVQECRRFDTLHACDSCKRILCFDPDAPPPVQAEVEAEVHADG
ncbi:MAG: hypothetical protein GY898_32475 [Proteobacteria bacterium]|nr:hypothetical protein [Pseudomonadota bacterium]